MDADTRHIDLTRKVNKFFLKIRVFSACSAVQLPFLGLRASLKLSLKLGTGG